MGSNSSITKYAGKGAFFTGCRKVVYGRLIYGCKIPKMRLPLVLIFARKSRESGDIRLFFAESFGGLIYYISLQPCKSMQIKRITV
jgi:hypothetical protein